VALIFVLQSRLCWVIPLGRALRKKMCFAWGSSCSPPTHALPSPLGVCFSFNFPQISFHRLTLPPPSRRYPGLVSSFLFLGRIPCHDWNRGVTDTWEQVTARLLLVVSRDIPCKTRWNALILSVEIEVDVLKAWNIARKLTFISRTFSIRFKVYWKVS
jgi:hypothetical protein